MSDADQDVLLARRGDRAALERLLIRQESRLTALARRKLGDGLRARLRISDVLQSTFVDAVQSMRHFDGDNEATFARWLETLMTRTIQDRGRFFAADKRREPSPEEFDRDMATPQATPSDALGQWEDLRVVEEALTNLNEEHRRVIELHVIQGRSHREVAEILGRPESSCRVLLTRARVALALEVERRRSSGD